ncbi:MAG: hypothetical protein M1833_003486 [Piccolia ochrophora]|nr:MAG: hypothetical protein M1833_003486 [Piccolia ochrophora]
MGRASQIISVVLRVFEVIFASVVAGIVGRYISYLRVEDLGPSSRISFAVAIAGLSIAFALILAPPLKYSFWAFPLDFVIFILWVVAFGLLVDVSGGHHCTSSWYYSNWGYYYGGYNYGFSPGYSDTSILNSDACTKFRTTLAFCFMGAFCWLLSSILARRPQQSLPYIMLIVKQGLYVILRDPPKNKNATRGMSNGEFSPNIHDKSENDLHPKTSTHDVTP